MYDGFVESRNLLEFVIRAKAGSYLKIKMFWTPAFAGVTIQETFYKIIHFNPTHSF
jgi:hypothetical protein